MELDLQSLFGLLCTAVLIGWDPATSNPPIYEGAIGQPKSTPVWPTFGPTCQVFRIPQIPRRCSLFPQFCFQLSKAVAEIIVYIIFWTHGPLHTWNLARRGDAGSVRKVRVPVHHPLLRWPGIRQSCFFLRNEDNRTKAHNLNQLHNKGAF